MALIDFSEPETETGQPVEGEAQPVASADVGVPQVASPVNTTVEEPESESATWEDVADIGKGLLRGAELSVNATSDLVYSTGKFLSDVATDGWDKSSFTDEESPIRIPDAIIPEVSTVSGEIASGISEFTVSFLGAGKFGKLIGLAKLATGSKKAEYAYEIGKGMLADTMGFKAQTQNITSMLAENFPSLDPVLADFMKNDGNDNRMINRLKNAIEGAGLGIAMDEIIKVAKLGRAWMKNRNNPQALGEEVIKIEEEAAEATAKTADETAESAPTATERQAAEESAEASPEGTTTSETQTDPVQEPNVPSPYSRETIEERAGNREVVTDPVERTRTLLRKIENMKKHWEDDSLSSQDLLDLAETARLHGDHLDLLAKDANFRTYAQSSPRFNSILQQSQKGLDFLKAIHAKIADKELERATKQSFTEVRQKAAQAAKDIGLKNVADIYDSLMYKANVGKEAIKDAMIARMQLQSILVGTSKTVRDLAERISLGTANYSDYVMFETVGKRLQAMYKMDVDMKTAGARFLVNARNTGTPEEVLDGIVRQDKNGRIDLFRIFDDMPDTHGRSAVDEWTGGYKERPNNPKLPEGAVDDGTLRVPEGRTEVDLQNYKARMENAAKLVLMCNGDPKRMFGIAKTLGAPTWGQQFNFWFTQQILSGINTHIFNFGGNILKSGLIAGDRIIGAAAADAVSLVKGESTQELKYALQYANEIFSPTEILSALKFAIKAGKENTSGIVAAGNREASKFAVEGQSRMMMNSMESFESYFKQREAAGEVVKPWERYVARVVSTLGGVGRLNARVMLGEDELFRQLHFNAAKREMITRRLDAAGIERGSKEWKEAFAEAEESYFTKDGLVDIKNSDAKEALDMASRSTFSEEIEDTVFGTGANKLIEATTKCPPLKVAMPFIKTVYNVALDSVEHIPGFNMLSKRFREEITGKRGFRAQEEAYGKLAVGSALALSAYMLVESGMITGAASNNPKIRDAELRAGKKPYSIRIGDTWVSYQRADPIAACLGAVANYYSMTLNSDDLSSADADNNYGYILGSFIANIVDKSFLTGFHDLLDAAFSGNRAGEMIARYAGNQVTSLLPASGLVNQMWRNVLPNMTGGLIGNDTYSERDSTFTGSVMKSGYADVISHLATGAASTPKKYDWVTGQPVERSVFISDSKDNDFVISELEREASAVYGPPQRVIGDTKLTPEQYSRLCELHGTVTDSSGKTMIDALEDVMSSPDYDYYRDRYADDKDIEGKTFRGDMLIEVMRRYRNMALNKLYEEYPEILDNKLNTATTKKANRQRTPISDGSRLASKLGV